MFAGVMILDMILLAWMVTGYKYVDYTTGEGVVQDVDENYNMADNAAFEMKKKNEILE